MLCYMSEVFEKDMFEVGKEMRRKNRQAQDIHMYRKHTVMSHTHTDIQAVTQAKDIRLAHRVNTCTER